MKRVGQRNRIEVEGVTIREILASDKRCACGCGAKVLPWAITAPGHYMKFGPTGMYQAMRRDLRRRIDLCEDSAERMRWEQLEAGVAEQQERWKTGAHSVNDLAKDIIVAWEHTCDVTDRADRVQPRGAECGEGETGAKGRAESGLKRIHAAGAIRLNRIAKVPA